MSDDRTWTDLGQQVLTPNMEEDSQAALEGEESGGKDLMAASDAAESTAPPPQEGVAHLSASSGSGEPLPEGPRYPRPPRTMSRWNEWLLGVQEQFLFEDGERISEFSDDGRWKPYDKGAQAQLRAL